MCYLLDWISICRYYNQRNRIYDDTLPREIIGETTTEYSVKSEIIYEIPINISRRWHHRRWLHRIKY